MDAALWQKAAEFGLTSFLLVLTLVGGGLALWKVGNKLVEATSDSLKRQAEAADKTAMAVQKIGDLAASIHVHAEATEKQLSQACDSLCEVKDNVRQHSNVFKHLIHAATGLTPEQNERVRNYLEDARRALDER